jgi:hypothetical protein
LETAAPGSFVEPVALGWPAASFSLRQQRPGLAMVPEPE